MPLVHGGYLECGPINGLPACRIPWTYEVCDAPKVTHTPPVREPMESEQIWQAVQDYYRWKGTGIPPAEAKACLAAIKEEREALKNPVAAVQLKVVPVVELPQRPEYGTPAFWKWCRETKAAREKAKAEKEAAKEAKAKAREEAKAAKEAKAKAKKQTK